MDASSPLLSSREGQGNLKRGGMGQVKSEHRYFSILNGVAPMEG
jgi:hypothetical protein